MLEPLPAAPKRIHLAFALTPEALAAARSLARKVADQGAIAASPAIGAWLEQGVPASSDRRTPLDPRLAPALAGLAELELWEEGAGPVRDAVMAKWSASPREVWRSAERDVMLRVIRTQKLVAMEVPDLFLQTELEGLVRAIERLDGPPCPIGSSPDVDPGPIVELRYAIERHATHDLSLGEHIDTFRALRTAERFADRPEDRLAAGEPLLVGDARGGHTSDDERLALENVRALHVMKASALVELAQQLAASLASLNHETRAAASRKLDADEAPALRGGDYVAAAAARLEAIAADAQLAERDGLMVIAALSE